MDKELTEALKRIIKAEIGEMVHDEIKTQFEPIQKVLNTIIDENRKYHDNVTRQITEDRKDINQTSIDTTTGIKQNKVILNNQNTQGEELANIVKEEAQKIPQYVEKSVEKMFSQQSFLKRIGAKFVKK